MASQRHFFVVFTVLFLSLDVSKVSASKEIVDKVCGDKAVTDRQFCMSALSNIQADDVLQLTDAAMKEAATKAQATLNVIVDIMKKPNGPKVLEGLKTCEDVFKRAVGTFKITAQALSEDPQSSTYDVGLITADAKTCSDALASAGVRIEEIGKGCVDLQNYSTMAQGMAGVANEKQQ